jgi:hypothetical protein
LPNCASSKRIRASRFSLELKSWSQVLLNASVAGKKEADKHIGKRVLLVKHAHHLFPGDSEYLALHNRGGGGLPKRLSGNDTCLAYEFLGTQQSDGRFLAVTLKSAGAGDVKG